MYIHPNMWFQIFSMIMFFLMMMMGRRQTPVG